MDDIHLRIPDIQIFVRESFPVFPGLLCIDGVQVDPACLFPEYAPEHDSIHLAGGAAAVIEEQYRRFAVSGIVSEYRDMFAVDAFHIQLRGSVSDQ